MLPGEDIMNDTDNDVSGHLPRYAVTGGKGGGRCKNACYISNAEQNRLYLGKPTEMYIY